METNVKIAWQYKDNGMFALLWGDTAVLTGYAKAYHVDGRGIDTRTAVLKKQEKTHEERGQILTFHAENGLCLTQRLAFSDDGTPMVSCALSAQDGQPVETNRLHCIH